MILAFLSFWHTLFLARTTTDNPLDERRDRELQAQRSIFEEEYRQLRGYVSRTPRARPRR